MYIMYNSVCEPGNSVRFQHYNIAMDKEFWHERWRTGQIGFHTPQPHWALEAFWQALALSADEPVLVPLCGKSLDMRWLRQRGHPVEGIELDPIAVQAFFDEWQADGSRVSAPTKTGHRLAADGVSLWITDFFDYRPERPFSAFYDRAALIALPQGMRSDYIQHLRSCLRADAKGLLVSLEYDQNQKDGPPFSVSPQEIEAMDGFKSRLLERRDVLAESPKFLDRGVPSLHESVYELTAA